MRISFFSLFALAVGAVIGGCGSGSGSSSSSAPSTSGAISVSAKNFAFSEKKISAHAGKVQITLKNSGPSPHELLLLKTASAPASLKVSKGQVSESGDVGEIAEIGAGASKSHTFALKPGHYVFVCNIPGHYSDGMRGELDVR